MLVRELTNGSFYASVPFNGKIENKKINRHIISKFFTIEPTGQTLDVVLPSFEKETGIYFGLETKTQKQLRTPIPVLTNKNGFHACCGENQS